MIKKEKKKELKNGIRKNDGFTFIETIVVLSIIAVLAAGSTVSAGKLVSKARVVSCKNQIEQYSSALQTYFLDCGCFPTTEQGIKALWEKPEIYPIPKNWQGPYLEKMPSQDPWGSDYQYYTGNSAFIPTEVPENIPYVLYSFGSDGKEGGEGEAQDVVSWK